MVLPKKNKGDVTQNKQLKSYMLLKHEDAYFAQTCLNFNALLIFLFLNHSMILPYNNFKGEVSQNNNVNWGSG